MGDKITAKETMRKLGVPCVPGSTGGVPTLEEAYAISTKMGFPVIVKATAGGGGRGMKLAKTLEDLKDAFFGARSEAKAAFGNDEVYIEKYLTLPRHIEVQVFGDGRGRAVHLGERDCSLQRRHQKVFEEALVLVSQKKCEPRLVKPVLMRLPTSIILARAPSNSFMKIMNFISSK